MVDSVCAAHSKKIKISETLKVKLKFPPLGFWYYRDDAINT